MTNIKRWQENPGILSDVEMVGLNCIKIGFIPFCPKLRPRIYNLNSHDKETVNYCFIR